MAFESARRRAPNESIPCTKVGMPGGDGGDGHRHAEEEEVLQRQAAGGADGDHDRQRRPGHDAEPLGEAVELLLERRLGAVDRLEQAGDLADLGLHARGRHDRPSPCPGSPRCSGTPCRCGRPAACRRRRPRPRPSGCGALSPVRAASWVSRLAARIRRPSAATMSPDSTASRSPGTTSMAGIATRVPSRITRASGTCICASASTLARAASSWRVPRPRLRSTSRSTTKRGRHLADDQAGDRDDDQHDVHRVPELAEGDLPHRGLRLLLQLVRAVADEPVRGLGRGQPPLEIGVQQLGHLLRRLGVPRRARDDIVHGPSVKHVGAAGITPAG